MILETFFANDINRNIETVIKADDQEHIFEEIEEYVVTNEVINKTRDFFAAYNDYTPNLPGIYPAAGGRGGIRC